MELVIWAVITFFSIIAALITFLFAVYYMIAKAKKIDKKKVKNYSLNDQKEI